MAFLPLPTLRPMSLKESLLWLPWAFSTWYQEAVDELLGSRMESQGPRRECAPRKGSWLWVTGGARQHEEH